MMKKIVLLLIFLSFFAFLACDDAALDYSGTWTGIYTEDVAASIALAAAAPGSGTLTLTITHTGTTLTGFGDLLDYDLTGGTISGTVTAEAFSITINFGDSGNVTIIGTFSSETSASGSYNTSFGPSGTFIITRQ